MKTEWKRGDKSELARLADTTPQRLCDILHRRSRATPEGALKLEAAAVSLGYLIKKEDWIYSKETSNPLFSEI